MIRSFACADSERLFAGIAVPRFKHIERTAMRKLLMLHAATTLATLKVPPANQLEALSKERRGQYSIRVKQQWRICFRWRADGAHDVEIVDYH